MTLSAAPAAAAPAADAKVAKKVKGTPEDRLLRRAVSTSGVKKLARANNIKRDSALVVHAFREIARVFCQEVVRIQSDRTAYAKRQFVNEKDAAAAIESINDQLMISPALPC